MQCLTKPAQSVQEARERRQLGGHTQAELNAKRTSEEAAGTARGKEKCAGMQGAPADARAATMPGLQLHLASQCRACSSILLPVPDYVLTLVHPAI